MIDWLGRIFQTDRWVLVSLILLLVMGTIFVYSSSTNYAQIKGFSSMFFFLNHLEKMLIGLVLMLITFYVPFEFWYRIARVLGLASLVMLLLLLVLPNATSINGAKRWIFGIQPSEFSKICFILFFARKIIEKQHFKDHLKRGSLSLLVVVSLFFLMLFLQPNYSSGVIYWVLALAMLFYGGFRIKHILLILAVVFVFAGIFVILEPYRVHRLITFFNDSGNYQSIQSLITLGNGGIFGVGLGESTQKLGYLPMPFTDMIFSIIGEEIGFIGIVITYLILFFILIWRGFKIADQSLGLYESLVVVGSITSIMIVGFIHMGVCVGLIPITGQPLPFVSYGGSALVVNMGLIGFVLQASYYNQKKKKMYV